MAWIGVECEASIGELATWGAHLKRAGAPSTVYGVLAAMARLLSGAAGGVNADDRMREIERRAGEAAERKRAQVAAQTRGIIARVMGDGVDAEAVLASIRPDGWRAGSARAGKNGAVMNGGVRRRKAIPGNAVVGDGGLVVAAERGRPAVDRAENIRRRRTYGESWEGWCGVVLRDRGYKMTRVAKALGVDVNEAWRAVSGWTRYWRAENLAGRVFPGPKPGWEERMRVAADLADNVGVRGRRPVRNGNGDCGVSEEDGNE